ncbi:MAG TPA: AMP-binding protein, partial [Ramlibacter sp.]|nr:AMP-binding protein [Ramlibacter sp.]
MLTFRSVIARNAAWYPDHPAYVEDGRSLSHAAYADRVGRLAGALAARGVRRQERVAILAMNSIAYCEVYGACEWSGAIAATINFRLAPPEVEWI